MIFDETQTQQKSPWYRTRLVLMTAPILVVLLGGVGAYLLFAPPGDGNAGTEAHYAELERHRAAQHSQPAPPTDAAAAADPQAGPATDPAAADPAAAQTPAVPPGQAASAAPAD